MTQTQTTLAALKTPTPVDTPPAVVVRAGFDTADGFALMQRGAMLLANSTMVPEQYRNSIVKKDKWGGIKTELDNPAGLSNCVIALNMATRMGADPLMIMQNLYIVEGRPAWSSQYIIASINACGKYSPLRFKMEDLGEKDVEYEYIAKWVDSKPVREKMTAKIHDMRCVAWALEKNSNEVLESPPVTIELAVKEGWYNKNGSKWQTMPEVMLRYRAASFFGKLYAPELLMGIQTHEEVQDMTYDLHPDDFGKFSVSLSDMKSAHAKESAPEPQTTEQDQPAEQQPAQRTRPTAEEMDTRRSTALDAWLATGKGKEDAEALVNAFAHKWTSAQCAKVEAAAKSAGIGTTPTPEPESAAREVTDSIPCPMEQYELTFVTSCLKCPESESCAECKKYIEANNT